jgi:histidinol dehydrogenase
MTKAVISLPVQVWASLSSAERKEILARPTLERRPERSLRVREIIQSVREGGESALIRLTKELDGADLTDLEVSREERKRAQSAISSGARYAMERAKNQIEKFHRALIPQAVNIEISPGCVCGRVPRPLERVGLYIPGGTAPLPSTVLMLAIPAALADCPTRLLCSPPDRSGAIDPHILVAAEMCGVDRIFKLGGAQAIAALAYGAGPVEKVDKIFGPGNAWVTEAKGQVSVDPEGAAIDMPAGPSEVLVIADRAANADFVAADLLSQAEHGVDSQVILLTDDPKVIEATCLRLEEQLSSLPRREIAEKALSHSRLILVSDLKTALEVSNQYAPEHLILQVERPEEWMGQVVNAGSVFLGQWSPEAMGDYASGTNHVLPTYGFARSMSGISVDSFMKQVTFQKLSPEALQELGPTVEKLAEIEALEAHRQAVFRRREVLREAERRGL